VAKTRYFSKLRKQSPLKTVNQESELLKNIANVLEIFGKYFSMVEQHVTEGI
jgi:hypothetical protein